MTHAGIECFLAICRHKTASAAARSLYITQPSLSARLNVLEQEVGAQLFYRRKGSREMTLTEIGQEFFQLAEQYEELIEKMKTLGDANKNTLRISCFSSLDTYLLPAVYKRFLQTNSQFSLETQDMDITPASQCILQGTTDFAFTSGRIFHRQLQRVPIFSEPMVLICAADSELRTPAKQADLLPQNEIFVGWSPDFTAWHRKNFDNIQPHFKVSSMVQLQQFLEQEKGWSIVPISVAKGLVATGHIRQLETGFPLPRREISYVISAQRAVPALEAFLDCLRQELKKHPELEILL